MRHCDNCDMIVIGSGPGGEGAAMKAVKSNKCVCVIERYMTVGGGCTHWGTIPSKALRHVIGLVGDARQNPLFRDLRNPNLSFVDMIHSASSVIQRQVHMREGFYERNHVPVIQGMARFVDSHTIEVTASDGTTTNISAEQIIMAPGSRPYRPDNIDFDNPYVRDADTILEMDKTPGSVVVYGAGVIGCEYASMLRGLDIKINLINTRSKLLEFLDDEIVDALAYHMRDQGMIIRHNEKFKAVDYLEEGVVVELESGKKIKADLLLWANGRTGNTDGMRLEEIGVTPDSRGQIAVNENFQTTVHDHIYAVGDVTGPPALASVAYDQGRYAASHACDGDVDYHLMKDIPVGIYTSPEISSVGKNERELTELAVPYEMGHAQFKSLARAQILGKTTGMLKLLFHRDTLEILGIHCFGHGAAEIIHIGQAIMAQPSPQNTLNYFVNTTFNYPTMAEAYRVAALNGLNRVF